MKITAIESNVVKIPFTMGGPQSGFGGKTWTTADILLVKVDTDAGITGWGEAFGYNIIPATKVTLDQIAAPLYIGRDATQIGGLMAEMQQRLHIFGRNGPVNYALGGIDIALWDIAGKAANLPLHRLLGGATRTQLPTYASLMPYREPAAVAKITERALTQGYRHVKLHEIDVPQVKAAREAGGDGFELMLDTNCPWTPRQAVEMAKRLVPYRLRWLEEPVWPPENFEALAAVRRASGIPTAAGENAGSVVDFRHMFKAGAVTYAQPSVTKIGGITEMRKVMALAEANSVTVMPHCPYFGPGFLASLHLLAAWPQETTVERLYIDLEASLFGGLTDPVDGKLTLPQGPGLGMDPDPEIMRRYGA
jgi:D-galactarolactone cycloisomerase